MSKMIKILAVVAGLLLATGAPALAQQVTYDPNAETFSLLSLNSAFNTLAQTAKEFIRVKQSFDQKLISQQEYDRALGAYRQAKISYDMALMRILTNASYVIVEKAVKKVREDGSKIVEITVKNEVGGTFELHKLSAFGARETELAGGTWDSSQPGDGGSSENIAIDSDIENLTNEEIIQATLPFLEGQMLAFSDVLNLLEINNLFISLQARTQTGETVMISSPYERKIPKLRQNERATVSFELLRDVENCIIDIRFGDKGILKPVYLRLESTAGGVELNSQIPSLQADLDSTATFNLELQRFSSGSTAFALRIANLPEQIDYNFIDPDNNNQQVTSINFTEGSIRKTVQLQLTMPTRSSEDVVVDRVIPFKALVLNPEEVEKFDEMAVEFGRNIPEERLASLNAGITSLSVTPLGVGRIEVTASTFYYPIQPDEKVDMTITVKNTGTGELKNVMIKTDLPNNEWNYSIEPELIRSLNPEQEQKVKLAFEPPSDAVAGQHILKVKVEAKTRNRVIEADDKEVNIEIKDRPDIWGRLILIVLLIGIVLGIVIFGIKLSRR